MLLRGSFVLVVLSASACANLGSSGGSTYGAGAPQAVPAPTPHRAQTSDEPPAHASSGLHYDAQGRPTGRQDPDGHFYDATGASTGRRDADGRYYDETGAPQGRIDPDGHIYGNTGAAVGRVDASGHLYDATGAPLGRIDPDGHVYDKTGAPTGRVDGPCDEACRQRTAGKLLLDK